MNALATPVVIDITMPELHKHIKAWQIRNPSTDNMAVAMELAIAERWPGASIHQVLEQAEINWLSQERLNLARDKAKNPEKWINTTVQGDMFNDLPVSVPEYIIQDGKPVEYWKCSLPTMLEFIESRITAMQFEEDQLLAAAAEKRRQIEAAARNAGNIRTAIERAVAQGIDPASLTYAKAG